MTDETPYRNREIREMFDDVKVQLDRIENQTIKTNGRVSALESWKWFITGGLAILSILVIPVVLAAVKNLI